MSTSADTVRTIEDLPCWRCTDLRGADLRHALAQTGGVVDEKQCSPASGLPLGLLSNSIDVDRPVAGLNALGTLVHGLCGPS
jgi:hypothetical protein